MKRWPLVLSFVLFVVLCASAAYWVTQLFKPPLRPVAAPPRTAATEVKTEDAAALFGGRAGKAQVASNYQLRGVIFSGKEGDSVAILSADGKPAQAVRVNMEVLPGVTVEEVHREYVLLSENGVTKRVELPENAKGQADLATISPIPTRPSTPIPPPPPPPPAAAPSPPPSPAPQQAAPQPAIQEPTPTVLPNTGVPNTVTGLPPAPGQQAPQQMQQPVPQQAPTAPPTTVVNPGMPAQSAVPGNPSWGAQPPANSPAPTPTPTYPAGQPMPRAQR